MKRSKLNQLKKRSILRDLHLLPAYLLGMMFFTACTNELSMEADTPGPESGVNLTLSPDPSELITIEGEDMTSARATTSGGIDQGRFNINLKYILPPTDRQREVFSDAAGRWERIIIGDVPSFTGTVPSAFSGFPPVIDGTVDDVVIEVALAPIDGPGGILGQAGPRFVRTADFLTLSGVMFFDEDDLELLERFDLFEEVIVHEMGHVLGVGTLWNFGRTLRGGQDSNPYFLGEDANIAWNAEGGDFELPVENFGGPGTALSHWRESALNNELMTGFLNLGVNPLSRITAASMRDLGYTTATVGETYDLPKGTPGVDIEQLIEAGMTEGLHIGAMEVLLQPIGVVTSSTE